MCHLTQNIGEDTIQVSSPKFHLLMKKAVPKIEVDLEDTFLEYGEEVGGLLAIFSFYLHRDLIYSFSFVVLLYTSYSCLLFPFCSDFSKRVIMLR